MKTWQTKQTEKKEYHTAMGTTDFNIPMFGYRSALFIMMTILITLLMISAVCGYLQVDNRMPSVILGGLVGGLSVAYSQFYIERRKGICISFWIVTALIASATGALIYLLYFTGMVL